MYRKKHICSVWYYVISGIHWGFGMYLPRIKEDCLYMCSLFKKERVTRHLIGVTFGEKGCSGGQWGKEAFICG